MPPAVADYVLIHELMHLQQQNHGPTVLAPGRTGVSRVPRGGALAAQPRPRAVLARRCSSLARHPLHGSAVAQDRCGVARAARQQHQRREEPARSFSASVHEGRREVLPEVRGGSPRIRRNLAIDVDGEGGRGRRVRPGPRRRALLRRDRLLARRGSSGAAASSTEALALVTQHAFGEMNFLRLFALPFADNPASARVLEKAGYDREALLRSSAVKFGEPKDQWLYARINPAWQTPSERRSRKTLDTEQRSTTTEQVRAGSCWLSQPARSTRRQQDPAAALATGPLCPRRQLRYSVPLCERSFSDRR